MGRSHLASWRAVLSAKANLNVSTITREDKMRNTFPQSEEILKNWWGQIIRSSLMLGTSQLVMMTVCDISQEDSWRFELFNRNCKVGTYLREAKGCFLNAETSEALWVVHWFSSANLNEAISGITDLLSITRFLMSGFAWTVDCELESFPGKSQSRLARPEMSWQILKIAYLIVHWFQVLIPEVVYLKTTGWYITHAVEFQEHARLQSLRMLHLRQAINTRGILNSCEWSMCHEGYTSLREVFRLNLNNCFYYD